MSTVRWSLDLAVSLVGVAAWSFVAFVLGSRFISGTAGGLLGVGLGLSALAMVLGTYVQEARMRRLAEGACPRCHATVASEHRHRRWDPEQGEWLPPQTSWQCKSCAYVHSEAWACPGCATAA